MIDEICMHPFSSPQIRAETHEQASEASPVPCVSCPSNSASAPASASEGQLMVAAGCMVGVTKHAAALSLLFHWQVYSSVQRSDSQPALGKTENS